MILHVVAMERGQESLATMAAAPKPAAGAMRATTGGARQTRRMPQP